MNSIEFYKQAKIEHVEVADSTTVALRQCGQGEAIVFIHGFPTSGYTWRHILPTRFYHTAKNRTALLKLIEKATGERLIGSIFYKIAIHF